jgi:hypothetical protein
MQVLARACGRSSLSDFHHSDITTWKREMADLSPEVTRKRLHLETMEKVLGDVDKIILENNTDGGQGVVPYLPLNELRKNGGSN